MYLSFSMNRNCDLKSRGSYFTGISLNVYSLMFDSKKKIVYNFEFCQNWELTIGF